MKPLMPRSTRPQHRTFSQSERCQIKAYSSTRQRSDF